VYSSVNGYEGRPTDSQIARTDALAHELEDVIREFSDLAAKQLPGLNRGLEARKLAAIQVITEEDWRKTGSSESGGGAAKEPFRRFERMRWGSAF